MSTLIDDLGLVEGLSQSFAYTIFDDSKLVMDWRKEWTPSINHEEVYLVGHRLMEQGEFRFHLAVIIADDMGSFSRALSEVQDRIWRKFNTPARSLLIYVCNLYLFDQNLQASVRHREIADKIVDHQIRDEKGKVLVYSLLGANSLFLETVHTNDALIGIYSCYKALTNQGQKDLTILKACLTQSISMAFDSTIESRVEPLKTILDTLPDAVATLH